MNKYNMNLLTDFYQLTMAQGYYKTQTHEKKVVFDLFYRSNPHGNGFAIFCGLEQMAEYIKNLNFSDSDIEYLRSLKIFEESFLKYMEQFKFSGTIHGMPEGTVVFPYEPLIRVCAPIIEAQIIETALLNIINHQTLIATKAARVVWAAGGDGVLEFGLRRAQGPDAGIYGSRASVIAGCIGTSNVLAGKKFGIPVRGTHAHSWVMSFENELTAFREYAKIYKDSCILLVDTYDTLNSGIPNAIKVFSEMRSSGITLKNYGVRLDSGDFAYLPKKARRALDDAGFTDAIISVSNDLDENLIYDLKNQGTKITSWGVGTNLITSNGCGALGGVYKLCAEESGGVFESKIKISENIEKITNPGVKKVVRFYDKESGKLKADLITLADETISEDKNLTIFHPVDTWKTMTLKAGSFVSRELLQPIFVDGQCVYDFPAVMDVREYCIKEQNTLWDESRRLTNPHIVPVDLSQKLYDLKQGMLKSIKSGIYSV